MDRYSIEYMKGTEMRAGTFAIYRFTVGPCKDRRAAVKQAHVERGEDIEVISARCHNPFPGGGGKVGHH